ncbi:hypothetical protein [Sandaracinus amylolyticus]|uniref:hypothetical protein n=1 Tax=Sandaracinus amylolyticus TaxID=927083 RepID=UPI001F461157|nr:hypothetical protein [Sandaracinus amylolyticus]UJR81917.1 Hypothetical protein I5071_39820 [Sandaracinus amylolyticus]
MAPRRSRAEALCTTAAILLCGIAAFVVPSTPSLAQPTGGGGYAWDDPDWRFVLRSRPVKVVLLAGSIGAWRDEPYGRLLHNWCGNAEVRNLSRVGYGAWQLYEHFRTEVLDNPRLTLGAPEQEYWLVWNGGLNSAGVSHRTNHYIRRTFRDAHRRGMRVVGMTLTPWGSFDDERRWGGARGLETWRSTRRIVDFVMGRIPPREALGEHAQHRELDADAPWASEELADVRIDLYDSVLRDRGAAPRDVAEMRRVLEQDSRARRMLAAFPEAVRMARLDADSRILAELPRWFLRPEYRGFDPVHPNREGHRLIAETVCPQLPESWGCSCPSAPRASR